MLTIKKTLFQCNLEIAPLEESAEGLLMGGFIGITSQNDSAITNGDCNSTINGSCTNTTCEYSSNTRCNNSSCRGATQKTSTTKPAPTATPCPCKGLSLFI